MHRRACTAYRVAADNLRAMRAWAPVVVALLLVAACSQTIGGRPTARPASTAPTTTSPASPAAPTTTSARAAPSPPAPGAPIADVIAWIEAGQPADPRDYHSATREGAVTELEDSDVAFTTPSGKTRCMTDSLFSSGDLSCLVKLTSPPPQPNGVEGEWIAGWVDYGGTTLTVGSVHGDPGPFIYGDGGKLPNGQALKFTDFKCRVDETGLFCVNYAHQSAARISDAGIEPFGCLKKVPPPADIGVKFSCEPTASDARRPR
jgi:hypothetical protein